MQPTDPNPAATGLPLGVGGVYPQNVGTRPPGGNTLYRAARQMGAYRDLSGQEETTGGIYKST